MNDQRKAAILTMFTNCPIVGTHQAARLFTNAQPGKRASAALCELEAEKLIEGRNRGEAGQCKVWRLSKKGREACGVTRPPVPLNSRNLEHYLSIADIWHHLHTKTELRRWRVELREPFGAGKTYCADAFAFYKHKGVNRFAVIESQLSPLTSKRWAEKWAVASAFFESPEFTRASFQDMKRADGSPREIKAGELRVLVLSKQQPDTIQAGTRLPLVIARSINEAPL